tara:strand:- start:2178 stop:2468 length:291 start_codon:yes stop_codon:yes gene_type:complete
MTNFIKSKYPKKSSTIINLDRVLCVVKSQYNNEKGVVNYYISFGPCNWHYEKESERDDEFQRLEDMLINMKAEESQNAESPTINKDNGSKHIHITI